MHRMCPRVACAHDPEWAVQNPGSGKSCHVVKRPGRIMGAQAQLYHVIAPDITIFLLANATDLDGFVAEIGGFVLTH